MFGLAPFALDGARNDAVPNLNLPAGWVMKSMTLDGKMSPGLAGKGRQEKGCNAGREQGP